MGASVPAGSITARQPCKTCTSPDWNWEQGREKMQLQIPHACLMYEIQCNREGVRGASLPRSHFTMPMQTLNSISEAQILVQLSSYG